MKYANRLVAEEELTLMELMRHHPSYQSRMRAHAILLNAARTPMNEIASIYHVHRNSVSSWIRQWEQEGLAGLYNKPRSGRPNKLNKKEQERVQVLLKENPRSPKKVANILAQESGKQVSVDTIKRIARGAQLIWKRIKKTVKGKRDEQAFKQAQEEIAALQVQATEQRIELYYFDESGFSLEPVVPYAWQPKGIHLEVPTSRSQRINVLGFLSKQNDLTSYLFEGCIDTQVVIACFDAFSLTLKKPTWIILDNAPQHTSNAFKNHLKSWNERGLFIKYLPAYSPELNLIEVLWRFIKYHWLPFSAYENIINLKKAIEEIISNFGTKYQINFA